MPTASVSSRPETLPCGQCATEVRVTERFAFGGMDRLRSTLACGHIVPRP